mgnify:CR=1 FL=1
MGRKEEANEETGSTAAPADQHRPDPAAGCGPRLGELAFGRANDCVRLVLEENPVLENLDLSLLSEVKRNEKGTVEIRLIDRLKALEQLSLMTGEDDGALEQFLQAVQGSQT